MEKAHTTFVWLHGHYFKLNFFSSEDELQTDTKQPMPSFETINSYETQTKFPINSDGIKDNQMEVTEE